MPTVLVGFLLPWTWSISSQLLQQAQPLLLTLDMEYLSTATAPDFGCGVFPLGRLQLQRHADATQASAGGEL